MRQRTVSKSVLRRRSRICDTVPIQQSLITLVTGTSPNNNRPSLQTSARRKHVGSSTSDLVKTAAALSNGGRLIRPYLSAAPRKRQMCDTICANPGWSVEAPWATLSYDHRTTQNNGTVSGENVRNIRNATYLKPSQSGRGLRLDGRSNKVTKPATLF